MTNLIVNLSGILIIAIIIWWFWFSKNKITLANNQAVIDILVKDGTYQPATIQIPINKKITLRFIRKDPSPCAETVIFATLNISKQLPINVAVDIDILIPTVGEHSYTCPMGMYKGKLIAVDS